MSPFFFAYINIFDFPSNCFCLDFLPRRCLMRPFAWCSIPRSLPRRARDVRCFRQVFPHMFVVDNVVAESLYIDVLSWNIIDFEILSHPSSCVTFFFFESKCLCTWKCVFGECVAFFLSFFLSLPICAPPPFFPQWKGLGFHFRPPSLLLLVWLKPDFFAVEMS